MNSESTHLVTIKVDGRFNLIYFAFYSHSQQVDVPYRIVVYTIIVGTFYMDHIALNVLYNFYRADVVHHIVLVIVITEAHRPAETHIDNCNVVTLFHPINMSVDVYHCAFTVLYI